MRPTWDEYYLNMTDVIALRSIDEDTKVGCAIVDHNKRLLATGYNSLPQGVIDANWPKNRLDKIYIVHRLQEKARFSKKEDIKADEKVLFEVDKYDVMTHAEINAISYARQSLQGATMYLNLAPCNNCAMAIIAAGITRIIAKKTRATKEQFIAEKLLEEAGVQLTIIEKDGALT